MKFFVFSDMNFHSVFLETIRNFSCQSLTQYYLCSHDPVKCMKVLMYTCTVLPIFYENEIIRGRISIVCHISKLLISDIP